MKTLPLLICVSLLGSVTLASAVQAPPVAQTTGIAPANVSSRVAALNALLAEQWQHGLQTSPEFATVLGDLRYNDRWSDLSLANAAAEHKTTADFLKRFQAIDTTGFPDTDKLNQQLMVRQLQANLKSYDLKLYEMPLDQMSGAHIALAGFVSSIPFNSTKEYDDYLTRLKAVPKAFDQVIEVATQGMADKMMPPKYLLEKVVVQIASIGKPAGMDSVFAEPLKHFPKSVSAADQKRLHDEILAAIDDDVRPAYTKLGKFVADDYAPHGRTQPGVWDLPNGDAIYRFMVKQTTTTDKTPGEIHAIGLAEVKRIEGEMTAIAKQRGYPDLASFRKFLKTDPAIHPTSREDILNRYRGFLAQMKPELPKLFGLLPKTDVVVMPVEPFREKDRGLCQSHHVVHRVDRVSRRHSRAPHADFHCADVAQAAAVSPAGRLHRVYRGLGVVRRAARSRSRLLQGPAVLLRAFVRRVAARRSAGA